MKKIEKPLDDILLKAIDETLSSEKLEFLYNLAWFEYVRKTEKEIDPLIKKYIKEALDHIKEKNFNFPISKKERKTLLLFIESGYLGGTSDQEMFFIYDYFKKLPKNLNEYLKKDSEVPEVLKKLVQEFKKGDKK